MYEDSLVRDLFLFPLPLFNGTILLFPMIETGYEDTR